MAEPAKEDRIVLTFDLDFGEVAALSGGRKANVVPFPCSQLGNAGATARPTSVPQLTAHGAGFEGATRSLAPGARARYWSRERRSLAGRSRRSAASSTSC